MHTTLGLGGGASREQPPGARKGQNCSEVPQHSEDPGVLLEVNKSSSGEYSRKLSLWRKDKRKDKMEMESQLQQVKAGWAQSNHLPEQSASPTVTTRTTAVISPLPNTL